MFYIWLPRLFFKFINQITYILSCKKCILCENINQYHSSLCTICWNKIKFINNKSCTLSKHKNLSVIAYNDIAKNIIHNFKYKDNHNNLILISNLIYQYILINKIEFDYIIPIPMSRLKLIKKGFNHTSLIANEISQKCKKPTIHNLLKKIHNKSQTNLSISQRKLNLQGKIKVNKNIQIPKNSKILLLDDVITTASTIEQCQKKLNQSGYKNIISLTLAKSFI